MDRKWSKDDKAPGNWRVSAPGIPQLIFFIYPRQAIPLFAPGK
jgi:hypothetical protein